MPSSQQYTEDMNEDTHSVTSLDSIKSIPLNEDLDYSDLTFNMKDLFSDISYNISSVYLKNVLVLIENFNEGYIDALLANCTKFSLNDQYQGYCQGTIYILLEFGELHKAVMDYSKKMKEAADPAFFLANPDFEESINCLLQKLKK